MMLLNINPTMSFLYSNFCLTWAFLSKEKPKPLKRPYENCAVPVAHVHPHHLSIHSSTHCCPAILASWPFLNMSGTPALQPLLLLFPLPEIPFPQTCDRLTPLPPYICSNVIFLMRPTLNTDLF